jgi:DUF1009 family protein
MPGPPRVVGIVAGGGSLPREIAEQVTANGDAVHIVSIIGEGDRDLSDFPLTKVGWAQTGGMLRALRNAGVTELVIVGSVRRPDLGAIKPDLGFLLNLPSIFRIIATTGDDGVLSGVVRFFESKGFKVVSPISLLPSLLVAAGPLGSNDANDREMADIARGFEVVRALGPFDVGQAVVVTDGRVEAIEGAENTDAMLRRLAGQRRGSSADPGARRGVLVKRPKPRQEMRVDMPAIGPRTVDAAVVTGLAGVAVLAGGAIALERAELKRRADAEQLFVIGATDHDATHDATLAAEPSPVAELRFLTVGTRQPNATQLGDAARGASLLQALAPLHRSHGTIVDRGHVLAIEGGEGAAALIARAGELRQWGRRRSKRRTFTAVLSREVAPTDILPVLAVASAANCAGIAVIGRTPDELAHAIETAERAGLFLIAAPVHESDHRTPSVTP